jgi:hypothetical protein
MTRKLTPMREFTLEMHEKLDCVHRFQDVVYKYAKLLGQKPTLGMFVPCDEEGNILEEPKFNTENEYNENDRAVFNQKNIKYQQAKSRVIFEGFELHFEYGKSWGVSGQGRVIKSFNLNTIEDLVDLNLTVKFEL